MFAVKLETVGLKMNYLRIMARNWLIPFSSTILIQYSVNDFFRTIISSKIFELFILWCCLFFLVKYSARIPTKYQPIFSRKIDKEGNERGYAISFSPNNIFLQKNYISDAKIPSNS